MIGVRDSPPRLFYDLTGLLHWYAYFRRPAGVQRVIEKIGACPVVQAAAAARRTSSDGRGDASALGSGVVEFVVRLVGTDGFLGLDPALLPALGQRRAGAVAEMRRLFAEGLRRSPWRGLARDGRYYHVPYLALGLVRGRPMRLRPVAPPGPHDVYYNPGDLWWQPGYAAAISALKHRTGLRILQVVHDFHVEERHDWSPHGFSKVFARELRAVAPHVDHWLTASQAVKEELAWRLVNWGQPARPISQIPYGWDTFASAEAVDAVADRQVLGHHGLQGRPYMLFVGTIEPRKNVAGLLDAVETLRGELGDRLPALVVVGGAGWRSAKVRRRLAAAARRGAVVWLQDLDDRTLAAVYRGARFTVMPSEGEGFGLAIQESLGHGVPCIATARAAMREAGRELAAYVAPGRPDELKAAIARWSVDEAALEGARRRLRLWLDRGGLPTWNQAGAFVLATAFRGRVRRRADLRICA
ncbi:MAG: glycosyltransferase [Pseudomonadota bacterium]